MRRGWEVNLIHTYREGNVCADWIAKTGASGIEPLVLWVDPPQAISNILLADTMGVRFCRN